MLLSELEQGTVKVGEAARIVEAWGESSSVNEGGEVGSPPPGKRQKVEYDDVLACPLAQLELKAFTSLSVAPTPGTEGLQLVARCLRHLANRVSVPRDCSAGAAIHMRAHLMQVRMIPSS